MTFRAKESIFLCKKQRIKIMADRVLISVPADTNDKVEKLAEKLDETKGKVVRMAVDEFARKHKVG